MESIMVRMARYSPPPAVSIEAICAIFSKLTSAHPGGYDNIINGLATDAWDAVLRDVEIIAKSEYRFPTGILASFVYHILESAGYPLPGDKEWKMPFAMWEKKPVVKSKKEVVNESTTSRYYRG